MDTANILKGICIGMVLTFLLTLTFGKLVPGTITIERSSDSEWERSDKNYPDTTTVDTVYHEYMGKKDTLYRTTHYLRVTL